MKLLFYTDNRQCNPYLSESQSLQPHRDLHHKYVVLPGFCDVHVHFREPGFAYKETIYSGSCAAAKGGYTDVCTMPNLAPVPDSAEHLRTELEIIEKTAVIGVHPYGALTIGEKGEQIAALEDMAPKVIGFSDDGNGIASESLMRELMMRAKALGKIIAAHCEDRTLVKGGYIHDGVYANMHGHKGICSESESGPIERDLRIAKETGCAYHVCHISTKESVRLIRKAKAEGINVTCETAPHYLTLTEEDLKESGRFKMNPPLRSREDREELLLGLQDGTIDMIATDHAPHSPEEKDKGLEGSAFGIVGLETAFPVLYTKLVETGVLSLEKLVALFSDNPRARFGIPLRHGWSLWDLDNEYTIDPKQFLSLGHSTPFDGITVKGLCLRTGYAGRIVYER